MPNTLKTSPGRVLMHVLLPLLLMACASNSPLPVAVSPRLPSPPSLSTPLPQQTYSSSARTDIERWQSKLTDTSLMSAP